VEVGLEINRERKLGASYCLCHQNAGQNIEIKIRSRLLENVSQFKYLGMIVINQNLIQGEIK
jgi:hypothetical protein